MINKARSQAPLTWRPPSAARGATAATLLRRIGRQLVRQLRANMPGTLADRDPEYLHQLRVAVRRLRVLLRLARSADDDGGEQAIAAELKWLAQLLGPARDSDVFRLEIWPPLQVQMAEPRLAQALDAAWLRQRHRAVRKAQQALASPRFIRLLSGLTSYFATPSPRSSADPGIGTGGDTRVLHAVIRRRARRVRAAYAAVGKSPAGRERRLHRLRIEIKKLRYALEFFAPLLKRHRAERALKRLARLQSILGEMNDISTAQAQIEAALSRRRSKAAERAHGALRKWRAARLKTLQRKFNAAWKAYRQAKAVV